MKLLAVKLILTVIMSLMRIGVVSLVKKSNSKLHHDEKLQLCLTSKS